VLVKVTSMLLNIYSGMRCRYVIIVIAYALYHIILLCAAVILLYGVLCCAANLILPHE
jgi:ABC-type microcin C transport system permease subunit YejE